MPRVSLLGAAIGGLGVAAVFALVNCADPTQIVVEVFTDACPGSGKPEVIHSTGIAVGTADNIEARRPASTHEGCETATGIGTLTIYPSGAKDAEVAIKVLGGVESAPDRCDPPAYAGCIVHRRMLRFIPHVSQRATVLLTLACLNRQCPPGTTCDNGACVGDRDVLDDGGASADAQRTESGVVAPVDAAADGPDPCIGCIGTCAGGRCTVDCSKVTCAGDICAPHLPCDITCPKSGGCDAIACTTDQKCTVTCTANDSCEKVDCNADVCSIACKADGACNSNAQLTLIGRTSANLDCEGKKACRSAQTSCSSNNCSLKCQPTSLIDNACPSDNGPCVSGQGGGCEHWNKPNSGN